MTTPRRISPLPKISVITVVYNRAEQIAETMRSVFQLEYENLEYIVIDGGSTDGTAEIIRTHADSIDHWLSEPDQGIYYAMNKGIELATGDWINFMNCGDRFATPQALNFFTDQFQDADVLYGNAIVQYPGFKIPWANLPLGEFWKRAVFCHQAAFVKTGLMKEYFFDVRFRVAADFDFLFRLYTDRKRFLHVDKLICYYDFQDGASIRQALKSFDERRKSVLARSYSIGKVLYFTIGMFYLRISVAVKKIIGPGLTQWITRLLRK